jgi:predicted nucleic acid-binding protein
MRRLRVLLDANVIVDAQIRDLFCRVAEAELIDLRWSSRILEESRRTLVDKLRLDPSRVDRLCAALLRAFPDATVAASDSFLDDVELPDPDDRHVLAAAVHSECDLLVTNNVGDFPDAVAQPFDLSVLTADDSLVLLAGLFKVRMVDILDRQITALRRPRMSREQFLDRLASRAPLGATALGAALGVERYTRLFEDIVDTGSDLGPQGAVRRLLSVVEDGRLDELSELVDPALATRLTGLSHPTPDELCESLRLVLEDVVTNEGWGFGTARRLQAPGTELVKLVRAGSDAVIFSEPRLVQGHLFYLRSRDSGWTLVDLDGPDPSLSEPAVAVPE